MGFEGSPGGHNGVLGGCQKGKILLFQTFAKSNVGPKEVPEGKMVFSGGAGSGKYNCFTLLQGPMWVRRKPRRAKLCSRVSAVRTNLKTYEKYKTVCIFGGARSRAAQPGRPPARTCHGKYRRDKQRYLYIRNKVKVR